MTLQWTASASRKFRAFSWRVTPLHCWRAPHPSGFRRLLDGAPGLRNKWIVNHLGMGMSRLTMGIVFVASFGMACAAYAGDDSEERSGMLVTGSIVIGPDGSVQEYGLDREERLPGVVVSLVGKSVPTWRFEPLKVGGQPVAAKAAMNLRIIAKEQKNGDYSFTITSATFPRTTKAQETAFAQNAIPAYPAAATRDHVSGTVYLTLRVNQQGTVVDGYAEEVDLVSNPDAMASKSKLKKWRSMLAESSLATARTWKLDAVKPADATTGDWYVKTPIYFHLLDSGAAPVDTYGKWNNYLPGPIEPSPWSDGEKADPTNLDAIPAGSLALAATGLHLSTPLGIP